MEERSRATGVSGNTGDKGRVDPVDPFAPWKIDLDRLHRILIEYIKQMYRRGAGGVIDSEKLEWRMGRLSLVVLQRQRNEGGIYQMVMDFKKLEEPEKEYPREQAMTLWGIPIVLDPQVPEGCVVIRYRVPETVVDLRLGEVRAELYAGN